MSQECCIVQKLLFSLAISLKFDIKIVNFEQTWKTN